MANNDYKDYDEINDAILLQAEDGITYSPGSADYPNHQPPILPDPSARLASSTEPSPHKAVLATAPEGGLGLNGAEASGMARTTSHPSLHAEPGTAPSNSGCHTGELPMDVTDSSWADRMDVAPGQDVLCNNIPDWPG